MYCERVINSFGDKEIDINYFKNTVEKVLGIIKGIYPKNILDIGFGRGKFLYPFLEEFKYIKIKSIDENPKCYMI
jgi:hypothetical protein